MKKIILLSVVVTLTTSTFASPAPESCLTKLGRLADKRHNQVDTVATLAAGGTGLFLLTVPVIGWGLAGVYAGTMGAATVVMEISFKEVDNAVGLFVHAGIGKGPRLDKLWRKFKRKYPQEAAKITYKMFAESIHKADLDGSACAAGKIPTKKGLMKIVLSDADDVQEASSVKQSSVSEKKLPQENSSNSEIAAPAQNAGEAK